MKALLDPRVLAERLLANALSDRYQHVAGVAARTDEVARRLGLQRNHLVAAAWLHDIGYASSVVESGFHPLDGARYIAAIGYDEEVVNLVAFHSEARVEAQCRGLLDVLRSEFDAPDPDELALLTYCDLTTGPRGQRMTFDERIAEIFDRYAPDEVVHQSIKLAEPALREAIRGVEVRLGAAQSQ